MSDERYQMELMRIHYRIARAPRRTMGDLVMEVQAKPEGGDFLIPPPRMRDPKFVRRNRAIGKDRVKKGWFCPLDLVDDVRGIITALPEELVAPQCC